VLASLVKFLGDFDLAEDAAAEAFASAAQRWPRDGTPKNPRAWLLTTAKHAAIDVLRRKRTFESKKALLMEPETFEQQIDVEENAIPDERLELIFGCCHPALSMEAQVALTLRALGGLTTEEIARAFLVTAETMKRRLTRAKAKIKEAGIPFSLPPEHLLHERVAAVLAVVYLIFNEGYVGRNDLADEAIRLARVLALLMPYEPEVYGLLALLSIHNGRREARLQDGELVLLADQDRSLWDMAMIDEGRATLDRALALGGKGSYVLQAAIASLQTEENVDWAQVAMLYGRLEQITQSPVVTLNRAAAVAEAGHLEDALRITGRLPLDNYVFLHSTRAELLRRLGRMDEAEKEYRRALELAPEGPERRFLARKLAEICPQEPSGSVVPLEGESR
jgi:RNA polymerase sigma-70 factor (ECF subfamily)